MIRLVRRPLIPGEFDAERWISPLVPLLAAAAWIVLRLGLTTPGCLFRKLTGVPCLGCGGTRCVRSLASFDLPAALGYSPLVSALALAALAWSAWSLLARLRGDPLRVRLVTDERGARRLRLALLAFLALHWAWICHHLPA